MSGPEGTLSRRLLAAVHNPYAVRRLPLLLAALALAGSTRAQDMMRGSVIDAETGDPIEFVHVFVDGTTTGDVTDADGAYSLPVPTIRPFRLVASIVGYQAVAVDVRNEAEALVERTIEMRPELVELGEFVVEAEQPREWRRNLDLLEEILFSSTPAGHRCSIENPEYLELDMTDDGLVASSPVPVVFDNPWLGYRVTVYGFRFRGTRQLFRWSGRVRFEEMGSDDPDARSRWAERRREAYTGSMRHFLRALATDRVVEEGFDASLVQGPGVVRGAEPIMESGSDPHSGATRIVYGDPDSESRSVMFSGALLVQYRRERESPDYLAHMRSVVPDSPLSTGRDPFQSSWLELPYGLAIVDTLGNVVSDGSAYPLSHFGYWAWERIGEMLPADYLPSDRS